MNIYTPITAYVLDSRPVYINIRKGSMESWYESKTQEDMVIKSKILNEVQMEGSNPGEILQRTIGSYQNTGQINFQITLA